MSETDVLYIHKFSLTRKKGMEYKYILYKILGVVKIKGSGYLEKSVWVRKFSLHMEEQHLEDSYRISELSTGILERDNGIVSNRVEFWWGDGSQEKLKPRPGMRRVGWVGGTDSTDAASVPEGSLHWKRIRTHN